MTYTVTVNREERGQSDRVEVEMGQTILEAALAAGLPFPHGCRSGNCGACKSALLSGEVELSPYSEYALTRHEHAQGFILACRAVPWSDAELRWLDADDSHVHPRRRMDCRVTRLEAATHDIRIVRLAIEKGGPFSFSAGQFASVTFNSLPARDYSMANAPALDGTATELEFHIRLTPGGAVSPFVQNELKAGDVVHVDGPLGTSYLREKHDGPVVALAGGSGLAPILSIVETALAGGMAQPIRMYFGVRDERDVYMERRLETLAADHSNFSCEIVLSKPESPAPRRTGFLHDVLAADFQSLDGHKLYLAGPPVMVEAAVEVAQSLGAARRDCHADAFYTSAELEQREAS